MSSDMAANGAARALKIRRDTGGSVAAAISDRLSVLSYRNAIKYTEKKRTFFTSEDPRSRKAAGTTTVASTKGAGPIKVQVEHS